MSTDVYLPEAFQAIRDKDEKFLWVGKPARVPFVISGIPFLMFGTLWFCFDYFGFIRHMGGKSGIPLGFVVPFFALHLFPFWASLLNIVRLFLAVGNTYYAVSAKRLLLRTGFWGTDFQTVDFDQIANFEVSVNPIENIYGVGTITAMPRLLMAGTRTRGLTRIVGVRNPYEVFKLIKQTAETKPSAAA